MSISHLTARNYWLLLILLVSHPNTPFAMVLELRNSWSPGNYHYKEPLKGNVYE